MDSTERQVIDELFDKIRQAAGQSGPRDPEAEARIRHHVAQQSAAPYYMAQAIIIQEQASHASTAKTSTERESSIDARVQEFARLHWGPDWVRPVTFERGEPGIVAEATRDFDGAGSTIRSDSMVTRVQGRVVDIRPNGNLVVEASKKITMDEEEYTVTLTGVCRTRDVTPDNSIQSTRIAELEVVKKSSGAVKDATKRGWLHKAMDFVNPF